MSLKVRLAVGFTILAFLTFLASLSLIPQLAVYVTVIALGLAVALQKYVATFFGFFVIYNTKVLSIGDRVRIGNLKGDVRRIGFFHLTLEEVGEDEKLGGELTGRLLYVPNLVILDQPVLNYSKDYSARGEVIIASDYIFDEVRLPITTDSDVDRAKQLLEEIIQREDKPHMEDAARLFGGKYPDFLKEAQGRPRVLVHIEPQHIWLKGKFVAPVRGRNDLRTQIVLSFLREARSLASNLNGNSSATEAHPIKLA